MKTLPETSPTNQWWESNPSPIDLFTWPFYNKYRLHHSHKRPPHQKSSLIHYNLLEQFNLPGTRWLIMRAGAAICRSSLCTLCSDCARITALDLLRNSRICRIQSTDKLIISGSQAFISEVLVGFTSAAWVGSSVGLGLVHNSRIYNIFFFFRDHEEFLMANLLLK